MPFVSELKTVTNYIFRKAYQRLKPQEKGWFIGKVAVAIKLASAVNQLHELGICYANISDQSIMVDPFDGRMVLIKCDDIIVPGKLSPTVVDTRKWHPRTYRPPELVTGTIKIPSTLTDRHALASILYHWLLLWDPLRGEKIFSPDDSTIDDYLRYGEKAIYIEHPTDPSNRASKQALRAAALGTEVQKLFQTAFVDGLHNPGKRPSPYEWQQALFHMYDQIIPCASEHCDWHFFVATPTQQLACPRCSQSLKYPPTLPFVYLIQHRGIENFDQYITKTNAPYIVGWPGRLLYQWHVGSDDPVKALDNKPCIIFEFDQYTKDWYMKNLTLYDMMYTTSKDINDGWKPLPIDASVPLDTGMIIHFGDSLRYFHAYIKTVKVI